jgi:hypothetical protein
MKRGKGYVNLDQSLYFMSKNVQFFLIFKTFNL